MEHRLSTQFHARVFGYTGVDDVEITAEEFSGVNIAFLGPQWAAIARPTAFQSIGERVWPLAMVQRAHRLGFGRPRTSAACPAGEDPVNLARYR
jgi:hypothetical protein